MPKNVWLLSEIAEAGHSQMDVACTQCARRGRLSVRRLLAEYGPDVSLPELRSLITVGCRRSGSASWYERCDLHFPNLNLEGTRPK